MTLPIKASWIQIDKEIEPPILKTALPSRAEQIESSLLEGLLSLRAKPNFDDIVSTRSNSNQTLAHISVLYDFMSLLRHLVEWRIDLTVADIKGLTALHYAYEKEDRESIRILLRGGASTAIEDKLGRFPRDLAPKGSYLADWLYQPDPSLRPVHTVLRAANPPRGPVFGGPEIRLEMDGLPTTFALYVKFGDKVAATVSSTCHPSPHSSSNPPY